jgi:hypothetical protein
MVRNLPSKRSLASAFQGSFPLFDRGEFDFSFPNAPWPIAIDSATPSDLKKRIVGAFTSYSLRLKSVDYCLKNYLSDVDFPEGDSDRLDRRIRMFIDLSMSQLSGYVISVGKYCSTSKLHNTMGHFLSTWTLSRAGFSVEIAAYASQRGALFEAIAILRMLLEQVAWAYKVDDVCRDVKPVEFTASLAIRSLKKINNASGKLYGWMSKHVHWNYEAHIKSIHYDDESDTTTHLLASSYFKAVCFCAIIVMVDILFDVTRTLYSQVEKEVDDGERPMLPFIKKAIIGFIGEIRSHNPSDPELENLASMIAV